MIARDDQRIFYWELRSCDYYEGFVKPKVIYPQTAKFFYACYDTMGTFALNSTYFISSNDLSLLAILDSKLFDWYVRHKFQSLNDPWTGGRLQFKKVNMEVVPVADRTDTQKAALSCLVEQILADPQRYRDARMEI